MCYEQYFALKAAGFENEEAIMLATGAALVDEFVSLGLVNVRLGALVFAVFRFRETLFAMIDVARLQPATRHGGLEGKAQLTF